MTYGVIYKIENLKNNKVYIGQTVNYKNRLKDHFYRLNKGIHVNQKLQNAYNKYGNKFFEMSIIDTAKSKDELNEKEIKHIKNYKSNDREFGYNLDAGGSNAKPSTETKLKLSKAFSGSNNPMYGLKGENHPAFGYKHSKESKERISGKNNYQYIPNLDGKSLLEEFQQGISLKHLGLKYNTSHNTIKRRISEYMEKNDIDKREFDIGIHKSKSRYKKYGNYYDLYLKIKDSMAMKKDNLPFRVVKHKNSKCKQGFTYWYRYYENEKRKTLTSVNLIELKKKVLDNNLPWFTFKEMNNIVENMSVDEFKEYYEINNK